MARHSMRRAATAVLTLAVSVAHVGEVAAQAGCSAPRDPFLNPFSKASAHHRPIGTGAVYASTTDPATRSWLKADRFSINTGAPWGVHVADTNASNPLRSVRARTSCDKVTALPVSIRLPNGFSIPNLAQKACPDDVVVVFDRASNKPHQLRQYQWDARGPVASQYKTWEIMGLGHGTRAGQRIGTSASGVAGLFGLLRGQEMNTPGFKINHALQIVLPAKAGCRIMLSRSFVLPATDNDNFASSGGNNTGGIPYGTLLALPRTVKITSLGLSEPGRRLAEAIQNYGLYAVDNGGCNWGAIRADQYVSRAVVNQLAADIRKFYPLIRMVKNNNVLGSAVAGGGAPLAPNCAINA